MKRALEFACKLVGHAPTPFTARSHAEFQTICKYLSAADSINSPDKGALFVHISCHGNDAGLAFDADFMKWAEPALDFVPILRHSRYNGKVVLCLSACGSARKKKMHRVLTGKLENNLDRIPLYILSIRGKSVLWVDALVAWTFFYHKLPDIKLTNAKALANIFKNPAVCSGSIPLSSI